MSTKIDHSPLPHPPRSWLRKMSMNTRNRMMIHATQRKNHKRVQNMPSSG